MHAFFSFHLMKIKFFFSLLRDKSCKMSHEDILTRIELKKKEEEILMKP